MAENIGTAYVQIEPSFDGVVSKIDKEFGGAGESGSKSFGKGFASVVGTVGKVAASAMAAGTAAVTGLTKSAVSAFADFEQLEGGIETLFGDSADVVMKNSSEAFKSAGMSANKYMETAIQSAASMINSLGGDQAKAAEMVDMSITDMSDNVNKMGTDMEAVQNAYRGFSRGNFTMLDNLALGFAGTKEGMQQLLDEAEKISGVKFNIDSYADIVQAIHEVQTEMGITGTTAKEAADTISGSLAMMQSSWQNVLSAIGQGDMSALSASISELVDSAKTFAGNIMPVIEQALVGITQLIVQIAPEIASALPGLVDKVVPSLLHAGADIIKTLGSAIISNLPMLVSVAFEVLQELVSFIIDSLPQILDVGIQIILELGRGIADALPTLVPQIVKCIIDIVNIFLDNIPLLIDCGIQIINGLITGILEALPLLISSLPTIIEKAVQAIIDGLPLIMEGLVTLTKMVSEHMPEIIDSLIVALPGVIDAIVNGLIECFPLLLQGYIQLWAALAEHAPEVIAALISAIPQIIEGILSSLAPLGEKLWALFKAAFSKIGDAAKIAVDAVKKFFSELPGNLARLAGNAVGMFINGLKALPGKVKTLWDNILSALKTFGENFKKQGPEIAKKFIEDLMKTLKELPGKIYDLGKDIVNNLLEGIKNAWKGLTDTVSDMASNFIGGIKEKLSLKSAVDEAKEALEGESSGSTEKANNDTVEALGAIAPTFEEMENATYRSNAVAAFGASASAYDSYSSSNSSTLGLLAEYLPIIADAINKPIEVNQNDRGVFTAVRNENRKLQTATGYHALA